jgi:NAD(P)-dependent dehydrogenase (short-subunit alcohol dehydrogenase family)
MKTGRIVAITGAAGGMGALIVRRFLSNGDAVIATDTQETALAQFRSAEGQGGKLLTFAGDISKEEDCDRLATFAWSELGQVDVLVNLRGVLPGPRLRTDQQHEVGPFQAGDERTRLDRSPGSARCSS